MTITRLIFISRLRFWLYLFGPFLIGYTAGLHAPTSFLTWQFVVFGMYFLLPANIFIYGTNDIYDFDTDQFNAKKTTKEALVEKKEHTVLKRIILLCGLTGVVLILSQHIPLMIGMLGFLFFGYFYSSPPIRAKAIPFLDSLFNILYIMPALVGFGLSSGKLVDWQLFVAAGLWCVAMHAYSAVPDIKADGKANISTIATYLGKINTLWLCTLCYAVSAVLSYSYMHESIFLGGLYTTLMLLSMRTSAAELDKLYWSFPYINMTVGAGIWFIVLLQKFA